MNGKIIRTGLLAVGGIILTLVLLIIAVCTLSPLYNDSVLDSFSQQLYNCSLPKETVIIEKHKICGKLSGNGDGMDFLACILIELDKTIGELKKHFEALEFKGAKSSSKTAEIQVLSITGNKLKTEYLVNDEIFFNETIELSNHKNYAVVIYDGGYWNFLDGRGA